MTAANSTEAAPDAGGAAPRAVPEGAAPTARWAAILAPALAVLVIHLHLFATAPRGPDGRPPMVGPDAAMRMVRARELAETGRWYDPVSERSNTPFGQRLHWTRPMDVLLVAPAKVAGLVMDPDDALWAAGVWVNLGLELVAVVAVVLAAETLVPPAAAGFAGFLMLFPPTLRTAFQTGRPDHHGLILALVAIAVACLLRLLSGDDGAPSEEDHGVLPEVLGGALALAWWVSVECLVAYALVQVVLGVTWILRGGRGAEVAARVSRAVVIGALVALVLERGPGDLTAIDYWRFSLVHVCLAALVVVFWAFVRRGAADRPAWAAGIPAPPEGSVRSGDALAREGWGARLVVGLVGAAAVTAAMGVAFPKILQDPALEAPELLRRLWWDRVSEFQPLLGGHEPRWQALCAGLGAALLGGALGAWRCLRPGPGPDSRLRWGALLVLLGAYAVLGLRQLRWIAYVQLLAAPALAAVVVAAREGVQPRLPEALRPLGAALVTVGFAVGFALVPRLGSGGSARAPAAPPSPSPTAAPSSPPAAAPSALDREDIRALCQVLSGPEFQGLLPRRILAHYDLGPHLLLHTPFHVVGTPHGNVPGMTDTLKAFGASRDADAAEVLARRQLDFVLVRPGDELLADPTGAEDSFVRRLLAGRVPAFLERVPLPAEAAGDFRLFRLVASGLPPDRSRG